MYSGTCGPGHVGHRQVEEALARLQPRGLVEHGRRGGVGEPRDRLRADGLAGLLEARHRGVDEAEALDRVREPTGSGAYIAATRLPSAPRSASARTEIGTIAFSSRPSGSRPRRIRSARSAPVTTVRTTSLIVPPSASLIALNVARSALDPGEPPVRADPHVERARRRAGEPGARPSRPSPATARARVRRRRGRARQRRRARTSSGARRASGRRASAEQLGAARLGRAASRAAPARARGGSGVEVEQHGHDVHAGDPVDERVVGLADQREAAVAHRVDEPDLPQRLVAVELLGEHAAGERAQLVLARGRGQRRVAHVVADVEVRVVDPHAGARRRAAGTPAAGGSAARGAGRARSRSTNSS